MIYADKIYVNADVITVNDKLPKASAVGILGDKILKVGSENELLRYRGLQTEIINLAGKTMVPGFYDSHGHMSMGGAIKIFTAALNSPPMGNVESIDQCIEVLIEHAKVHADHDVIMGWGFDDTLVKDKRPLSKEDLDKVSLDKPVYVAHASGHVGYANSKLLELEGIGKDTPNPEGGIIQKDLTTGEPNGVLEETAMMNLKVAGLDSIFTLAQKDPNLIFKTSSDYYASVGVTTANEGGGHGVAFLQQAHEAAEKKDLRIRLTICPFYPYQKEYDAYEKSSPMITVQGTKILQDGSVQAYTAHMSEPYHTPYMGDANWCAYSTRSQQALDELVLTLYAQGQQTVCHCNGDQALEEYLNAIEKAQQAYPRQDDRPIVIHCQTARFDQVQRMKALNVTPSFFLIHTYYWGERHKNIFLGSNRGQNISPARWAIDAGIIFSTHCDTPVSPQTPLLSIWAAVNRKSYEGGSVGHWQCISPLESLKAYTINAAYQYYEEQYKGSIEAGKYADLVILDDNPLECDPMAIKDIKVLETIVGGETIYKV